MPEVCLLGTGGMMPLPKRYLTALAVRHNGDTILIDCGEGTQMALREKGWSPNPIDVNFLMNDRPFTSSQEAYDSKYIGGIADAVKLQKK